MFSKIEHVKPGRDFTSSRASAEREIDIETKAASSFGETRASCGR